MDRSGVNHLDRVDEVVGYGRGKAGGGIEVAWNGRCGLDSGEGVREVAEDGEEVAGRQKGRLRRCGSGIGEG